MNDPRFKKTLLITTAVHFAVVLFLVIAPLLARLIRPPKPPEMITFIDLQAMPPAPPPPEPRPEPVPPEPEPEIEEPKPSPIPEKPPDKPKPEPPKIKVNTNRIVRKVDAPPKPSPQQPKLTQEQIRKLLEANIKFSPSGTPSANFSDLSLYYATVRDAMYGAWQQPSAAARGMRAEASIRVQRNGAVTQRRISRSSGSKLMDDSVLAALNAVARLRPLPADVRDDHLDITIDFVVGE